MNIKTKLVTGVATFGMVATLLAPSVFAGTTVNIKNNGKNSTNKVKVNSSTSSTLLQSNETSTFNGVFSLVATGGNSSSGNTGKGGVNVTSGDAVTGVSVSNAGNTNSAVAPECGCALGNNNVKLSGNGKNSTNTVKILDSSSALVAQSNESQTMNLVGSVALTGGNSASGNTGKGGVDVLSGDAISSVSIINTGSTNTL